MAQLQCFFEKKHDFSIFFIKNIWIMVLPTLLMAAQIWQHGPLAMVKFWVLSALILKIYWPAWFCCRHFRVVGRQYLTKNTIVVIIEHKYLQLLREWRNWQTRWIQVPVGYPVRVRVSPLVFIAEVRKYGRKKHIR